MSARADLLGLDADALTALSNAGFVKRAQKDVAEGKLPAIEESADGSVSARYADGHVTTLPPGRALRDAACTCPASGLCRHRVTLVLAYQAQHSAAAAPEQAWCPSQLEAAVDQLPRATLEQAARLAAQRPLVHLHAGAQPAARLPMCDVRFLSRTSLAMARCDCQQGGNCAHIALAVWAFRQGQRQQPGFASLTLELEGSEQQRGENDSASAAHATVAALAARLWLDGTSQDPLGLEVPFEQARQAAARLGWSWVALALTQLQQGIAAQHARASSADAQELLHLLSALLARLAAARAAGPGAALPASAILGVGIKGELALDHLRLLPLGAQVWADEREDGVRMIWADPDTLAVTVQEKRWPLASTPIRERRLLGVALARLAASQVVTKAARRRANGVLTIGVGSAQTSVLPLPAQGWDALGAPLRQHGVHALRAHLRSLAPDFVRPLQALEHVHVLPVSAVLDCGWDAAAQVLVATLQCGAEDEILLLKLRHSSAAPAAIDVLARALLDAPLAVAGSVTGREGQLCMTPLAVMTASGLQVPQLGMAERVELPVAAPDDAGALVAHSGALLAQYLRQGLRHQGQGRAHDQASALRAAGFAHCADALLAAMALLGEEDMTALPDKLAALDLLLRDVADS